MRRTLFRSTRVLHNLGRIALASAALSLIAPLTAQTASPSDAASPAAPRLTQPVNEKALVTLHGTVHPLANAANDRGAAPDGMPLERMHLVLKRSSAQESALKQLISDMHTPGTASYHKWLTPELFGQQFGPSDQDIATVQAWLQSKGLTVTSVNPGKQTMEISGNVAQLRSAFHTQIHKYQVNGETHYANSTDPQIPAALAPVVGGFVSLNNFHPKRHSHLLGKASYDPKTGKATPQWTQGPGGSAINNNYVLSPGDYAVQYDLNPLYTAGINGAGQTIAIINDSNINVALVNNFRTLFNLPANPPQVIIDGNDPGIDGTNNPDGPNGDSVEAYLDVEWSGAVAPAATVDLVIGADTALESGLYLAAEHAVYGNIAPVISISFGSCEQALGSTNQFWSNLWEQAAAQGITAMVSTGDNGSAACDNDNTQFYAVDGQAVSGFASTPYNIAVGGTDFYYSSWNQSTDAVNAQLQTYWNTTPSNSTPSVSIIQAQAPIPEQPWNDSQYGLDLFSFYQNSGQVQTTLAGGSGGASNAAVCSSSFDPTTGTCTGTLSGYPKPSWQTGAGVPADKVRDIPDVALFASDGSNGSFYPECYEDGDCQPASSGGAVQIFGVGGTSASSPSFAGIMALVNQKYGRQGQADFVLYPLAAQFPQAFHDVTVGTNSVPCSVNPVSPDCIKVADPISVTDPNLGAAQEGQIGSGTTPEYNAGVGYDLASGLGSIDANQLVTNWGSVKFTTTQTTLNPSSASFTHGTSITVSGSVTVPSGTPTGDVALMTDSTEPVNQGNTFFTLTNGSFSNSSVNYLPGGTYNIWGQYSGDSTNGSSTSQKTQITVTPENSGIFFNLISPSGTVPSGTGSIDYGTQMVLSAQVTPSSQLSAVEKCQTTQGATCPIYQYPTGTVAFTDNGAALNTAVINAEGDAEYNAPFSVGSHSVISSYSGDNSYNKSTGSATTFTVVKDTPQIALSASNATSSSQIITGQATAFNILVQNNAQVSSVNSQTGAVFPVPVAPPTGTITVSGFPSGTSAVGSLSAGVDRSSRAVESVATLTAPAGTKAGNYNVTINYSGDSNYNATSGSGSVSVVSAGGTATTTTATVTGSISPTTSITITGTVTGQSGKAAPSNADGGILVYSSGYIIGQAAVTPGSGDSSTFSIVLNSQTLSQGANFLTIQYAGDSTYAPSAYQLSNPYNPVSNPLSDFSIVPETTIVPVPSGGSNTDTINLTSVNGFSGAVNFTCAASTITCSITSSATLASGSTTPLTLTINAGTAASGSYNVLVTGTDAATGKFIHTLAIQAAVNTATAPSATFSLSANPASLTLAPGATSGNTSTISVTPTGGFTGAVALACSVAAPSGATAPATCALGSSSANVTGTAAVTTTLTVSTTAATSSALDSPLNKLFAVGGGLAVAGLLFFGIPARRRSWRTILGILVFAGIVGMGIGCGSSSGSGGGGTGGTGGTTAGAYTVTVTGTSGSMTQTTAVAVTVN